MMESLRRVGMYRESPGSDIVKQGHLKKLKTMKKKFFVLRATSSSGPSRLDYFDNEKKFKTNHPPKKSYHLYTLFNINKKVDSKHRHGIAIFLPTECFSIIAESDVEQEDWINKMLEYQNEYLPQMEEPRSHYDYVWQGVMKQKSPSSCSKITGPYRLCLSDKAVSLVKLAEYKPSYQFQFSSIRKCGAHEHYFLMEVGRSAITGSGDIWLEVESSHTAQNMHDILAAEMAASRSADDPFRRRSNTSSSAISQGGEAFKRKRTKSASYPNHHHGSPRRNRTQYAQQRPQSTVVYSRRDQQLAVDSQIPPGSSPSAFDSSYLGDDIRNRSNSMGSRSSRSSYHSDMADGPYEHSSPCTPVLSPEGSFISMRSVTPEGSYPIEEEDDSDGQPETSDYLSMNVGQRSMTPSPTRSQGQMDRSADYLSMTPGQNEKTDAYLDMTPGSGKKTDEYLSMTPGQSDYLSNTSGQNERLGDYLSMTPDHRSGTPSPTRFSERLGSTGSQTHDSHAHMVEGYMDMKPGSRLSSPAGNQDNYMSMTPPKSSGNGGYMDMTPVTPPVESNNGYIDMNPGQRTPTDPGPGYVMMDGAWVRATAPIPIRANKEASYMDMGTQPLPTVKESGSGEAYLPMSPTGTISSEGLKPAKVFSYLSDDSMSGEFPKRAYSVGSRPISKPPSRYRHPQEILRHQPLDSSMSSSAPHLIVQKSRSQLIETIHKNHHDGLYNASPLSQSVKSDDSDSFVEMDFYRPRTASDSYGCRPRSSSFGKQFINHGHRPRSSSYGQGAKGTMSKLAAGFRQDSFESVRTTSQELSSRRSQESLGVLSSSSRNSSSDSLKKLSDESQSKKNLQPGEYMDMNYDKRKTPSPNVHGVMSPKKDATGYMDMSLGTSATKSLSCGVSPCSSTHSLPSSATPSLGSSPASAGYGHIERFQSIGHGERLQGAKVIKPSGKVVTQKQNYKSSPTSSTENQLKVVTLRLKKGDKRSPSSSGKESEDESYVPFQPNRSKALGLRDESKLHVKPPYELVPKSHPGLKVQHGYSRSHDSGMRSPEYVLQSPETGIAKHDFKTEKAVKGKKEEKLKTKHEERHKGEKLKLKKGSGKKSPSESDLTLEKGQGNPLQECVQGQSLSLEKKLEFIPDNDLFSNKIFTTPKEGKNNETKLSLKNTSKKLDDNAYLDYEPRRLEENISQVKCNIETKSKLKSPVEPMKPFMTKHCVEREYYEIDFPGQSEIVEKSKDVKPDSDYIESDPAPLKNIRKGSVPYDSSPLKEKRRGSSSHMDPQEKRKGSINKVESSVKESRKESVHNEDFSYMDFDPATVKTQEAEMIKAPQRVLSFVAHSVSIDESDTAKASLDSKSSIEDMKVIESDAKYKTERSMLCADGETEGVEKCQNIASIKCLSMEGHNEGEGQIKRETEVMKRGRLGEGRVCEGLISEGHIDDGSVIEVFKENVNTENRVLDGDNTDSDSVTSKRYNSRDRKVGKLIIKQIVPTLREGEAVLDAGYCDLDYGDRDVLNERYNRSESISSTNSDKSRKMLESIGSEDSIPCPETPISYISEDGDDIPIPETPVSYISDDSTSGSSVGSREFGSPFKSPLAGRASNPTSGKVSGFGLNSFGLSGDSLRKSLPVSRSHGGTQQSGVLSRQCSAPGGPSVSPRSSIDVQQAYRTRKASGPASLASQQKHGGSGSSSCSATRAPLGPLEPVIAGLEFHKQKSMPCMIVPQAVDKLRDLDAVDPVQSRHSFTDLSLYEEMDFPASTLSTGNQKKCSSQQQLTTDTSSNELHYADLDLKGSMENMDGTSPRIVKSRHPSSMDDISKEHVQYAEIDHSKTEKMKGPLYTDKEVKFYVN